MLTKQQFKLLSFLKSYQEEQGIIPSYDEMKKGLGIKSKSGIHALVSALEERGFLKRLHNRARAIEILKFPTLHHSPASGLMAREDPLPASAIPATQPKIAGMITAPFFGKLPSVVPISNFLQPKEILSLPQSLIKSYTPEKASHYMCVEVGGDFLKDSGIFDGDIVILEESSELRPHEICLAVVDQQEVYLKKISQQDNKIQLSASNKYMMPLVFDKEKVMPKAYLVGLLRRY